MKSAEDLARDFRHTDDPYWIAAFREFQRDAEAEGYRRGLEEAAKVCDSARDEAKSMTGHRVRTDVQEIYEDRIVFSLVLAGRIRALLTSEQPEAGERGQG